MKLLNKMKLPLPIKFAMSYHKRCTKFVLSLKDKPLFLIGENDCCTIIFTEVYERLNVLTEGQYLHWGTNYGLVLCLITCL